MCRSTGIYRALEGKEWWQKGLPLLFYSLGDEIDEMVVFLVACRDRLRHVVC